MTLDGERCQYLRASSVRFMSHIALFFSKTQTVSKFWFVWEFSYRRWMTLFWSKFSSPHSTVQGSGLSLFRLHNHLWYICFNRSLQFVQKRAFGSLSLPTPFKWVNCFSLLTISSPIYWKIFRVFCLSS
jgi:hypothetical protein